MIGFHHHQLLLLVLSATLVVCRERNTSSHHSLHPKFVYHTENWLVTFLHNVTEAFPHLTKVYSIGKSVQGLPCACIYLCELFHIESSWHSSDAVVWHLHHISDNGLFKCCIRRTELIAHLRMLSPTFLSVDAPGLCMNGTLQMVVLYCIASDP